MRLFVALNFSENIKDELCDTIADLRDAAAGGNFTLRDNLHLTLAFIGETTDLKAAREAVASVNAEKFDLILSGFGKFRRDGGDIYWYGVKTDASLQDVHRQVYDALTSRGFQLENRPFKPHLTLGRQVRMPRSFDERAFADTLPKLTQHIDCVSLMKSERIAGRLTYTEVFRQMLK